MTVDPLTPWLEEPVRHDVPSSIQHWQLRDLINAGDTNHEFYTVTDANIVHYDTEAKRTTVVHTLSFLPNCLAYKNGFLAAGGLRGELFVATIAPEQGIRPIAVLPDPNGHVNNALHIAPSPSGELQLFVCNNDRTIKVYRLPSMVLTTTLRTATPINYACLSPDMRHLCCVGDDASTVLYEATPLGYQLHAVYEEASDAGMVCSWSPGGSCFASAYQDGVTCVWDIRSARPGKLVHKYELHNSARNVKFSPGPIDLMAIAEHENIVDVVDTRRWDCLISLNVTSQCIPGSHFRYTDQNIPGIDWTLDGSKLLVGMDDYVAEYRVRTVARRCFGSGSIIAGKAGAGGALCQ